MPADVRFLETHALKVDESSLTGESANVEKHPAPLPAGEYALGDRLNLGYRGTAVTSGRATAYVVATGMATELGKIAALIQTKEMATPLQKRLATLGRRLAAAALTAGAVYFLLGWGRGEPLRGLLLVSVSLAIAAAARGPARARDGGPGAGGQPPGESPRAGTQATRRGNAGLGHLQLQPIKPAP